MTGPASVLLLLPLLSQAVSTVVIKGGTLLDVRTGQQIADSLIVIEGDRIKQVGRAPDLVVPQDAQVINAHGKWIIPGLMDMHARKLTHGKQNSV